MDVAAASRDIFEINDFTNASTWETFIADIEKILHQWGLAASDDHMLDDPGRQHCKTERLMYVGRKFVMTLVVVGDADAAAQPTLTEEVSKDDKRKAWSPAMLEMMDGRGDFPSDAHNITKWYGVRQFVLLSPDGGVECLTSQAQAKLMLSSVSIAISNTRCMVPFFIQTHKQWRQMFVGVAEGPVGIRVNFDTIHLKQAPSKFMHLSGLIDMFKSKISPGGHHRSPVHLAVRYTYVIKHWSLEDWPVELPEMVDGDRSVNYYKTLPVGAFSDPVNELRLSAVWPNLSEELVVDRDHRHTDLRPSHAPLWTVTTHLADRTECYLSDCLQSFLKICYRDDTLGQLIGSEREGVGSSPQFSHALDKLTNVSVSSIPTSPFLSSVVYSASQRLEFGIRGDGSLSDKKLEGILKCLFPDAYGLPEEEVKSGSKDDVKIKSSPLGSLSRQLATVLCIVNNDNGLRAFAELWNETVQELRYRWDQAIFVNSLPEGPPDMSSCLFHQKLQMLNCCIQHKRKHDHSTSSEGTSSKSDKNNTFTPQTTSIGTQSTSSQPNSSRDRTASPKTEGSDTDDEFFEALESHDQASSTDDKTESEDKQVEEERQEDKSSSQDVVGGRSGEDVSMEVESESGCGSRSGVLKQCGDLVLVATGEPLYIPVTQEHTPMTEDMMWEQQTILSGLGTSEQAAKVRAKMQSTSLLSDMQAFKAANPGSLLEDFVRWYSPRDWIEEATPPPTSPSTAAQKTSEETITTDTPREEERHGVCGKDEETKSTQKTGSTECKEDIGDKSLDRKSDKVHSSEAVRDELKSESERRSDNSGVGVASGASPDSIGRSDPGGRSISIGEEKSSEGDWGDDGWGQDDWGVEENATEDNEHNVTTATTKRYCRGRMSDRMMLPDNLWVETWKQATPVPTHKQVRLFNDTKEAEKVLHYFANMQPCELAVALMPLLLHSSVEALQKKQREGREAGDGQLKKSLARVDGMLADVLAMLATVQNPSLEVLPLYQECIGLLSQAEHLLASAHSLQTKLLRGVQLGGRAANGKEITKEVCVCTEMMLEGPELVIRDPMNSVVGVAMKGLLESQGAYHVLADSNRQGHRESSQLTPNTPSFPPATQREFILRNASPHPTQCSRVCPHRMYCCLQGGVEFRIAGAFSSDTNYH